MRTPQVLLKGGASEWPAMKWSNETLIEKCGARILHKCKHDDHEIHPGFDGWIRRGNSVDLIDPTQYGDNHTVNLTTVADLIRLQQGGFSFLMCNLQ